jgi:hypothetical protein
MAGQVRVPEKRELKSPRERLGKFQIISAEKGPSGITDGGKNPNTPENDKRRRPRKEASAADQDG